MEDIRLKTEPFEFDGKTYQLCCNMAVLADVQEAYGGKISNALSAKATLKSCLEFLAAMMNDYADLQGWEERYTAKQIGRVLPPARMQEVTDKVMPLVAATFSTESKEEDGKN